MVKVKKKNRRLPMRFRQRTDPQTQKPCWQLHCGDRQLGTVWLFRGHFYFRALDGRDSYRAGEKFMSLLAAKTALLSHCQGLRATNSIS